MGTCCSNQKPFNYQEYAKKKIRIAIERGQLDKLKQYLKRFCTSVQNKPTLDINEEIIKVQGAGMNALGLAMYLDETEAFKVLVELGGAKLSKMKQMLAEQGNNPIYVICEHGLMNMLKYYLPVYISGEDSNEESFREEDSEELSIFANHPTKSRTLNNKWMLSNTTLTPIMKACERQKVEVVKFLHDYFGGKPVPREFDVHHIDEYTGENCALISCKTGNMELIRLLFEKLKCNFNLHNKRRESALQIAAAASKKRKTTNYHYLFQYLVEVVTVDIKYEYEETLLLLEDKFLIQYMQEKLSEEGVFVYKSEIEEKYSSRNIPPRIVDRRLEEKLSKYPGSNFVFREVFKEELEQSYISSISVPKSKTKSFSVINI